jgi:magnesium transporter
MNPMKILLRQVQLEFKLHELAIEDAHRAHQSRNWKRTVILSLSPCEQRRSIQNTNVSIWEKHTSFLKQFYCHRATWVLITLHRCPCPLRKYPHLLRKGPAFALYAVMDAIVDQYFPVIDNLVQT